MLTHEETLAKPNDAINGLVDYASAFEASGLPANVGEVTKTFILDTMSLMLAGHRAPGCAPTFELMKSWGGRPEAMVVGEDVRLPAPAAALMNSLHAHAFDYDDTHERGDMHGYAVVLPAALAVAERVGGVSGSDFLAAVAVGVDVAYRVGLGIVKYRGWHPTATCGIFGATAAAARIMKFSRAEMHNAMGIAYSLSAGNFQCILDGSLTKRLQPAFAARAATDAALFAAAGITGAKNVLEGKFGFFPLYEAGEYHREPLVSGLGAAFEGLNASMKPYPSCRFCHAAVDMILDICKESGLKRDDVESIVVRMPAEAYDYVGGPYVPGDSPQVSAQFSIAYNVAVAIACGKVGLQEFDKETVLDPSILALAAKVEAIAVADEKYCFGPQQMTVRTRDGKQWLRRVVTMKGHPDLPMSGDERFGKVRDCIAYGGYPPQTTERLAAWVASLTRSDDVAAGLATIWKDANA